MSFSLGQSVFPRYCNLIELAAILHIGGKEAQCHHIDLTAIGQARKAEVRLRESCASISMGLSSQGAAGK